MQEFMTPQPSVSLVGRWIDFRPISQSDYPILYSWRTDLQNFHLWSAQGRRVPGYQEFVQMEMGAFSHGSVAMIALDRSSGEPVGFRRAYNIDVVNGWLWSQTYVDPAYRLKPHAAETVVLFLKYLFEYFPVRKVYSEVYEFDEDIRHMAERLGYVEEGRYKDFIWFRDRYWDLFIYALDRVAWVRGVEQWKTLLKVPENFENLRKARSLRGRHNEPT